MSTVRRRWEALLALLRLPYPIAWERLGNPGWNWKNYEKYIQRTEGYAIRGPLFYSLIHAPTPLPPSQVHPAKRGDQAKAENEFRYVGSW